MQVFKYNINNRNDKLTYGYVEDEIENISSDLYKLGPPLYN